MERRTLVRLLIGVGIGIPVLVEVLTLSGLIESELFGSDEDRDGDEGDDGVPPGEVVAVGDEVLAATAQTERIAELSQIVGEDGRRFRIEVSVEDPTDAAYTMTLDRVAFDDGTVLEDPRRSRLGPAEAGEVTATWPAPGEAEPVALVIAAETDGERYAERIRFGKVPVSGADPR